MIPIKFFLLIFVYNSLNIAEAKTKLNYTIASDEFLACDYIRFESHLEALKTGNVWLKEHIEAVEYKIQGLEKKVEKIPKSLQNIENKIMSEIKKIQPYPTNCADFNGNYCTNNKCRIHNRLYGSNPFLVSCDDLNEGGGWTVIQRRINGSVDFYRNWSDYKNGFGNIDGEFFIGLDKLHALTTMLQPMELLIQLQDFNNILTYAKYDEFLIGNEMENYKLLKVGKYSGNAGDSFSQHQGLNFTTKDRDNDISNDNCAIAFRGAWWYRSCLWSNLNGKYNYVPKPDKEGESICWGEFHGYNYSLKFVQMMIRPKRL